MSERTPSIDRLWYERFQHIGSFQAYEYLDGDKAVRAREKQRFFNGEVENPTLDYPKLVPEDLIQKEQALLGFKQDLLKNERDPMIRQLYRWKVNEKIAEVRMLRATLDGKMRKFRRYSQFIYGDPSPEVFQYTVKGCFQRAEVSMSNEYPDLQHSAAALLDVLPLETTSQDEYALPSGEAVDRARSQTHAEMTALIDVPEHEGMFTAPAVKAAFDRALTVIGDQGWRVVVDPSSKTAISVDQEHQTVKVPESRQVSREKLEGLIVHEIGTHVLRRRNGERSRLMLLGLGLDRYEQGEEGVATMREQAMRGSVEEFSGLDKHLAIGLARGIDGKPRTFRETFDVMQTFYAFEGLCGGKSATQVATESRETAWNTCVRVFRGTDCKTPGTAFTKDIIYTEGNMGVWNVVRSNPDEMMRFSVGKYDPANPRHLWVLDQLGITGEDLAHLERRGSSTEFLDEP